MCKTVNVTRDLLATSSVFQANWFCVKLVLLQSFYCFYSVLLQLSYLFLSPFFPSSFFFLIKPSCLSFFFLFVFFCLSFFTFSVTDSVQLSFGSNALSFIHSLSFIHLLSYSHLSLRRTGGPALCVLFRSDVRLIESPIKQVKNGTDQL